MVRPRTLAIVAAVAVVAIALILAAYPSLVPALLKPSPSVFPQTADVTCSGGSEGGMTFYCSKIPAENDTILVTFPSFGIVGSDPCGLGKPRTGHGTVTSVSVTSYGSNPSGSATAHITQMSQDCPSDQKPPFDYTFNWVVWT